MSEKGFRKEVLKEELEKAKKTQEVLTIKEKFFQNKFAVEKGQGNEYNLQQVARAIKEQAEWVQFLEEQL